MSTNNELIYVYEDYDYPINSDYICNDLPLLTYTDIKFLLQTSVCGRFENNKVLRFKFIGVITLSNNVIVSLPKCYTAEDNSIGYDNIDKIADIIKIFKTYKNDTNKTSVSEDSSDEFHLEDVSDSASVSEISIADYIIKDFLNYGLYQNYYSELKPNGNGDTGWQYTVEHVDPFISNGYPIYDYTYNREILLDVQNKITELHKWAIDYCIKKYGRILGYDLNTMYGDYLEYDNIGSHTELLYLIQTELSNIFESRKINLLKALNSLLNRYFGSTVKGSLSLYGTSKFDTIWEYVLQKVFKDEYYDEKFANKYNRDIFKPIWRDLDGFAHNASPIKPDIVRQVDRSLFIFDAKYYNIQYKYKYDNDKNKKLTVIDSPLSYDVLKQMYYKTRLEQEFNRSDNININTYINCFLFPDKRVNKCEFYEVFGTVGIDETIYNIWINPEYLFKQFIRKEYLSDNDMNDFKNNIKDLFN